MTPLWRLFFEYIIDPFEYISLWPLGIVAMKQPFVKSVQQFKKSVSKIAPNCTSKSHAHHHYGGDMAYKALILFL
jgi:hypothetical protein